MFKVFFLVLSIFFASQSFAQREGGVTGSGLPARPVATYQFRSGFAPKPTSIDCAISTLYTFVTKNSVTRKYKTTSAPFSNLDEVFQAADAVAHIQPVQTVAPMDAPMIEIEVYGNDWIDRILYKRSGEVTLYKPGETAQKLQEFVTKNCYR